MYRAYVRRAPPHVVDGCVLINNHKQNGAPSRIHVDVAIAVAVVAAVINFYFTVI